MATNTPTPTPTRRPAGKRKATSVVTPGSPESRGMTATAENKRRLQKMAQMLSKTVETPDKWVVEGVKCFVEKTKKGEFERTEIVFSDRSKHYVPHKAAWNDIGLYCMPDPFQIILKNITSIEAFLRVLEASGGSIRPADLAWLHANHNKRKVRVKVGILDSDIVRRVVVKEFYFPLIADDLPNIADSVMINGIWHIIIRGRDAREVRDNLDAVLAAIRGATTEKTEYITPEVPSDLTDIDESNFCCYFFGMRGSQARIGGNVFALADALAYDPVSNGPQGGPFVLSTETLELGGKLDVPADFNEIASFAAKAGVTLIDVSDLNSSQED